VAGSATFGHAVPCVIPDACSKEGDISTMIALGIILIIIGLIVASLHILLWIGIILLIIGLILNLVPIGGRTRRWY
jgi:hypothetical protein